MESDCDDDSPECTCPCGCGCQNDPNGGDLPFRTKIGGTVIPTGEVGVCAGCAVGRHEIPPEECVPIDDLIEAHQSILAQLIVVREERKEVDATQGKGNPG